MEGEYKHLVICTDVIKPHSSDRSIKSIVISSSCSSFPMNVFTGCTSLETVRIDCPNLKSLSMNAFKTCTSLTDVCLPDNITSIARTGSCNRSQLASVEIDILQRLAILERTATQRSHRTGERDVLQRGASFKERRAYALWEFSIVMLQSFRVA